MRAALPICVVQGSVYSRFSTEVGSGGFVLREGKSETVAGDELPTAVGQLPTGDPNREQFMIK